MIHEWLAAAPSLPAPCPPGPPGSSGEDTRGLGTQLTVGHGYGIRLLLLAAFLPAMGPAAWAEAMDDQGATVIEVTLRGGEVSGLTIELSRSISGRPPDYAWSGVTDASGRLVLTIPGR